LEQNHIAQLQGKDMEWTSTFNRLAETARVHTWEPILAALHTAEIEQATKNTTELCQQEMKELYEGQEHHFTNSKVLCAHSETEESLTKKTKQHGSDARAFNLTQRVMSRWTTLPLPSTETWIRETKQDPDLQLLNRAMKEKRMPLTSNFMPGLSAKESRAEERTSKICPKSHHDI
jgi:hypothetical protein